jgi:hypothetical protein
MNTDKSVGLCQESLSGCSFLQHCLPVDNHRQWLRAGRDIACHEVLTVGSDFIGRRSVDTDSAETCWQYKQLAGKGGFQGSPYRLQRHEHQLPVARKIEKFPAARSPLRVDAPTRGDPELLARLGKGTHIDLNWSALRPEAPAFFTTLSRPPNDC